MGRACNFIVKRSLDLIGIAAPKNLLQRLRCLISNTQLGALCKVCVNTGK